MPRIAASFQKNASRDSCHENGLAIPTLTRYAAGWLLDSEARGASPATLDSRKRVTDKLIWFMRDQEYSECSVNEIRGFLAASQRQGNSPGTTFTYYSRLRTFFLWMVEEGVMPASPMSRIKAPINRPDQIQPFTPEEIERLIGAARAKTARNPRRDEAILLLLLDSGMRASELCGLRLRDVDLVGERRCTVEGKGGKRRTLPIDRATAKAIWQYITDSEEDREPDGAVFLAGAPCPGEGLTRYGLLELIHRLGVRAGIHRDHCSPHTFRHSFSVMFLRAGGNVFTLKELLGHTTLTMVNRYVALAQADIQGQHRLYSPVARMRGR